MSKQTKPRAICAICGFEETRGRCRICSTPICDGCAGRGRNRQCPDCRPPSLPSPSGDRDAAYRSTDYAATRKTRA
jgi:hypothetical protein